MRRRKLRLPVLTVRTLLLVCGALVVVCVGVGLAMRASLTDYAHDGAAVEQLPFVVNSRASTDALSLHTREEIAAAALAQGAQQFLVVSAIGASTGSPSFYSRIKGRMERAVSGLGYGSVHIVRPSLLLGEREESRPGEEFAQKLSPLLSPLLKGALRKYRPVDVAEVAAALLRLAQRGDRGVHIHYLPLPD